jgi:quinolinate synthetase complex, A subunit
MNDEIIKEIIQLKKEKNAVILAHYYVDGEIQEIADYVGDSYYLSKIAVNCKEDTIVFAGVKFMGESAKLLNPHKIVLMPDEDADCPMAHMCDEYFIQRKREEYDDLCVVTYINSTAHLKTLSDVCVTSSNAYKIVSQLPNKNILFIPDQNLGKHIAKMLPEKNFIFCNGYCPTHFRITVDELKEAKKLHPNAPVLIHPECRPELVELSDYSGSTAGIIDYARNDGHDEFIVVTEIGVLYKMQNENPHKKFYTVTKNQVCPNMKKNSLEKIRDCLKYQLNEVVLDEEFMEKAKKPLEMMHSLAK